MSLRRPDIASVKDPFGLVDLLTGYYEALAALQNGTTAASYYALAANGLAAPGYIPLAPFTDSHGVQHRALPGMRVVFAYDPASFGGLDRAGEFEPVITVADNIKQTDSFNLSTFKMIFLLVKAS